MFHLIDSDACVREVTEELIITAGFGVRSFVSPHAYLQFIRSPDTIAPMAIITCFHLPGMNGYALVREARNQWPQQKAIIISGSMMKQDYVEIKQSICRYLAKPFAAVELYKLLQALSHCHSHCAANKHFRFEERCRFGLNHACPFYSAGQTASQAAVSSEPA